MCWSPPKLLSGQRIINSGAVYSPPDDGREVCTSYRDYRVAMQGLYKGYMGRMLGFYGVI